MKQPLDSRELRECVGGATAVEYGPIVAYLGAIGSAFPRLAPIVNYFINLFGGSGDGSTPTAPTAP